MEVPVDLKTIGYWVFLLILAYLLIANASGTNTVVGALGGQFTNSVVALQGRTMSGVSGVSNPSIGTGLP